MNEKLTACVSSEELERRWMLVRGKMNELGIDYLLMQNSEGFLGGTVRWFTDFSARHQMPFTVIFPAEGEMTTIVCGTQPPADNWPPKWAARGIGKHLGHVYFPTIPYTAHYDAELAASVIKDKAAPTIGLVEPSFIPMTFYEALKLRLPDAKFVDASDWMDEFKAIKSPEEILWISKSAAIGDAAMEELKRIVRPGIRDIDVYAELHCFLAKNGCERGLVQIGSGPQGTIVPFDVPHFQNRVIQEGDQVMVLIEITGPGGYYTEILRPIVVHAEPGKSLQEAFAAAVEVQEMVADKMIPGASASELWQLQERELIKRGFAPPLRSFAHAQGLSYLERPNLRPDETWYIKSGMNIAIHPAAIGSAVNAMVMDNYLVGEHKVDRIHKTPKEIIVV